MAKQQVECVRCHTVRYLDRMYHTWYDGVAGYRCHGKTACKQRRKTGNKLFRTELFNRREEFLERAANA